MENRTSGSELRSSLHEAHELMKWAEALQKSEKKSEEAKEPRASTPEDNGDDADL